jgi:hypothetical protein
MQNIDLSDCAYEHIKDSFYYGLFGDFKLVIDKNTGCFNATKLCADGNKPFRNWTRLERSKTLINYFENKIESWRSLMSASCFYEVKLQNNDALNKQITGQYVSKELILDIASWISVDFYDKCNTIIVDYFLTEYKKMNSEDVDTKVKEVETKMAEMSMEHEETVREKNDKIDELIALTKKIEEERSKDREQAEKTLKRMEDQNTRQDAMLRSLGITLNEVNDKNDTLIDLNEDLQIDIKHVKKQNKFIQRKLNVAVEDRAPLPEDIKKQEQFVLIKRNDEDHYPYYTIRAQKAYVSRKLKQERAMFEHMEILLKFECSANSKTLYVRIKESLKSQAVEFRGNNIDLGDSEVTEVNLVEQMKTINDSRKYV